MKTAAILYISNQYTVYVVCGCDWVCFSITVLKTLHLKKIGIVKSAENIYCAIFICKAFQYKICLAL